MKIAESQSFILHLIIGAVLISFSPVYVQLADVSAVSSGFYRMFFGLLGLLVILLFTKKIRFSAGRGLIISAVCGLFFFFDIYFWHKSIYMLVRGFPLCLVIFRFLYLL